MARATMTVEPAPEAEARPPMAALVEVVEAAPPAEPAEAPPPAERPRERAKEKEPERERQSRTMNAIQSAEEQGLKDWLDIIGTQGAYKVQLSRTKPTTLTVNGKTYDTAGYLESYDHTFEEEFLRREWGGGTYAIRVTRQQADGSFKYEKGLHRTLVIAGDPRLDRLPGNAPPPPQLGAGASAASGENPSIAKTALEMMRDQLDRATTNQPKGIDPAVQILIDQMREDRRAQAAQLADLQARLERQSSAKPPGDPLKDEILGTLIKGESARIEALRAQHESELRQLREGHAQEVRTLNERLDRQREADRRDQERLLDTIKSSYERELSSLKSLGDVSLTSAKGTFDAQAHSFSAENKRLERDNAELRQDIRELREKKDKSLLEQLKEIESLREALSSGDPEKSESAWEKVAATVMNPAALEQIGKFFGRAVPPAVQAQVAGGQVVHRAVAAPPVIVRDRRTGQRFAQVTTPQGTQLVPVKPILPKVDRPDGAKVEVPEVEPSQMALLVTYLERAFTNGQEPSVVAQSVRPMIPPNILAWIRDNDVGSTSGVELFLNKVAKLPGTSPLNSLRARNWLRKLAKALTDEEEEDTPTETATPEIPADPPPST